MKVHITNRYGHENNNIIKTQTAFAEAGHLLGFYEMGIFTYQVECDSSEEMSTRLDGIIAAVEQNDLVIVQLPTGNGPDFEALLMDKIVAYSCQNVLVLWHDAEYRRKYYEKFSGYIGTEKEVSFVDCSEKARLQQLMLEMIAQMQKSKDSCMQEDAASEEDGFIHIGFGLYDKYGTYSVFVGTAMQSVVEHTDAAVMFHILHDDTLTEDNQKKLIEVAKNAGQNIQFHYFNSAIFSGIEHKIGRFTIGTMFRLLLPEILSDLSKIIYLDADLFVNCNIEELWKMDIRDYCLAAARDYGTARGTALPHPVEQGLISADRYFNAGVLYINLENVRKKGNLLEAVLTYLENNQESVYPDQDAFNMIFRDSCYLIDDSWNCFVIAVREDETIRKGKIYHYAGTNFTLALQNEVDQTYFEILERTPWGFEAGINQLNLSVGRLNDRAGQNEKLLKEIAEQTRKIVFYGPEFQSMRNLMDLLCANDKNSIWLEKMTDAILEDRENYIICMLPEAENGQGIEKLELHGMENGKDFFVIPRLLPISQGGYF